MYWKQPITSECLEMDLATRLIFVEIMLHARNEDMKYPDFIQHGNKQISYQLKRGQSLFFAKSFKKLGASRVTIERSLKLLNDENSAFNMTFIRQPFGYIVTISNYDELTKMTFNNAIKQQSNSNQTAIKQQDNNKSVKNGKTVKNEKECLEILDYFNQTHNRKLKSTHAWEDNFNFWLQTYNTDEIKTAIDRLNHPNWWAKDKPDLELLFRKSNKAGKCDYINQLLELESIEEEDDHLYVVDRSKFATQEEFDREMHWVKTRFGNQFKIINQNND